MTDFERILITECNKLEEEGYKPTDIIFYEPIYSAYERDMVKSLNTVLQGNFALDRFIKDRYGLEVHVIGMDYRIGLIHSSMLVYHDPLKEKSK